MLELFHNLEVFKAEAEQQPNHLVDLEQKEQESYEDEGFDFVEALSPKKSSTDIPCFSKYSSTDICSLSHCKLGGQKVWSLELSSSDNLPYLK